VEGGNVVSTIKIVVAIDYPIAGDLIDSALKEMEILPVAF
jgi:hypothetical protein